uniref:Integrase catalytic domain-containing protein n=1 Tax=Chenopodium quinoa TaxID=63459 RepID=A0A803LN93_CHEQI
MKMKKWCEHCKMKGHTIDGCFKIHGFPDWFKNNPKEKGGMKYAANAGRDDNDYEQDDPLESTSNAGNTGDGKPDSKLEAVVAQEMMKMFNAQQSSGASCNKMANFAGIILVSNAVSFTKAYGKETWIIDSGASDHMCGDEKAFTCFRPLRKPVKVGFLDGNVKIVKKVGEDLYSKQVVGRGVKENGLYRLVVKSDEKHEALGEEGNKENNNAVAVCDQDVREILEAFFNYIENHFNVKVKTLRSDNGTEVFQAECRNMFRDRGIVHQRSIAGVPQQNGRVERKHRHLIETARTLRIYAGMPRYLWGECVMAATHIINLLPSSVLGWETPYERLLKRKANYDHLRIIGCLCYASNTDKKLDKFGNKGVRCVLVGYASDQKGYRVFDLEKKKVFVSRDVVFKENIFPFLISDQNKEGKKKMLGEFSDETEVINLTTNQRDPLIDQIGDEPTFNEDEITEE